MRSTVSILGLLLMSGLLFPTMAVAWVQSEPDRPEMGTADAVALKWKFETGRTFGIDQVVVEKVQGASGNEVINERRYLYHWIVKEVREDGTAVILLNFDRVVWKLQRPEFEYDSQLDDPFAAPPEDPLFRELAYSARSLVNLQLRLVVSHHGGIRKIEGAESCPIDAILFTPGNWPRLPSTSIQRGDTWQTNMIPEDVLGIHLAEQSSCELVSLENQDAQRLAVIRCESTIKSDSERARFEPVKISTRFDISQGNYVEGEFLTRFRMKSLQGQEMIGEIHDKRKINTRFTPPELFGDRGSSMFVFKDGQRIPILFGGRKIPRQDSEELVVHQAIDIALFNQWNDVDGDRKASFSEIENPTNQFEDNENFNCSYLILGLPDTQFRIELLSWKGEKLIIKNIRTKDSVYNGVISTRPLDAGMYFLVFYKGSDYLARIPFQVFRSKLP